MVRNMKIFALVFLSSLAGLYFLNPPEQPSPPPLVANVAPVTRIPNISHPEPGYQDYKQIIAQLEEWHREAPDLTELGKYGKTTKGQDLHYIKITNKNTHDNKPSILVMSCIHGNEPLATSTLMATFGKVLSNYGRDERITKLLDEREIYFIPVVSPDTYPHSRHVDGVDPNRNFPSKKDPNRVSVAPIKSLQDFFLQIKPKAALSGHTSGRVFLIPYGETNEMCIDDSSFHYVMDKVSELCQYRLIRTCQMYGHPIHGTEADWFYKNGAFATVMEVGQHQRIPTKNEITSEMNRVYEGVLYFMEKAPLVLIRP